MNKIKITLLAASIALLSSGCSALKECAPNGWNLSWYQPVHSSVSAQEGQTVAVGISGALPWGKQ